VIRTTPLAATVFVLTSPAFGHHADTGLDMGSVLAINGTVTEFNWRNPHTYLSIESTDAGSEPVEWTVQLGAAAALSRSGVTRDALQQGDQIMVELHPMGSYLFDRGPSEAIGFLRVR